MRQFNQEYVMLTVLLKFTLFAKPSCHFCSPLTILRLILFQKKLSQKSKLVMVAASCGQSVALLVIHSPDGWFILVPRHFWTHFSARLYYKNEIRFWNRADSEQKFKRTKMILLIRFYMTEEILKKMEIHFLSPVSFFVWPIT